MEPRQRTMSHLGRDNYLEFRVREIEFMWKLAEMKNPHKKKLYAYTNSSA